jgi:hypothetical protein
MPRAVLRKGLIQPLEPLPAEWEEGTELEVERASSNGTHAASESTDQWMDAVEALAARTDADSDAEFAEAIAAIRKEAKDLARQGKR